MFIVPQATLPLPCRGEQASLLREPKMTWSRFGYCSKKTGIGTLWAWTFSFCFVGYCSTRYYVQRFTFSFCWLILGAGKQVKIKKSFDKHINWNYRVRVCRLALALLWLKNTQSEALTPVKK